MSDMAKRLAGALIGALFMCSGIVSAAPGPKHGGTFVFAISGDPATLNPGLTTGVEALATDCKMFSGLLWHDREGKNHGELAEKWFAADDGATYTFKLRHDVHWHDGKPFNAADVKYTFENVINKFHPRAKKAFENVASVETPDGYTVVVRMKKPYAPFLTQMTCQDGPILPQHIYANTDVLKNPHNTDNPIGTGPFKFQSWTKGDRVVMVRNPDFFRKGLPYFDQVIAKIVSDPNSRIQGLTTGELDYVQSFFLPKEQLSVLKGKPGITLKTDTDAPGNYLLFLNVTRPPLNNKLVRQAILRGINRKQMLDQAYQGVGYVSKSAIHQKIAWAYDPAVDYTKMYPYDPKAANALLDKAGVPRKGGTRFKFRLAFNPAQAGFGPVTQIIKDNLAQLGIDVDLAPYEANVLNDVTFVKRDFDGTLQAYTTAGDPAIGIARIYVTIPPGTPFSNPTGYSNPKVDELWAQGALTPLLAKRKSAYFAVQKILAEDLPTIPLIDRTEIDAANSKLQGMWLSGQPYDQWDQVWRQ
ncbi:MAG: ABC transporter substrate-binding protein [Candidatus Velthaea sp.]